MSETPLLEAVSLPSLSIRGFRGIEELSIPRLGRVTLIAGKNNTGKSSILEAVRLLTQEATPDVMREILQHREENVRRGSESQAGTGGEVLFHISSLFHGFPGVDETSTPITISSGEDSPQQRLKMRVDWFSEKIEEDGNTRLVPRDAGSSGEEESVPALVVEISGNRRIYPIERIDRLATRRSTPPREAVRTPCIFVNPSSIERTETLAQLWDSVSLTDDEHYVVDALNIIDPKIDAISMIGGRGGDGYRDSRTAIVRSANFAKRVPLRSFGDGLNRLFGITLSLINARGGFLLIDEFENGLHYTVQYDAWRMIFQLACKLNVQVLATTHSWDCVVGFARALTELEEMESLEGILVRIDRIEDWLRPVEYTADDLQVVTRQGIEVR